MALEGLREALMQAACAQAVACRRFETVDDCALVLDLTDFEYLVNAAIAGRSTYHLESAATCLAHYGDAFCRVEPGREDPCAGLFTGTLAEGATCRVTAECAGELECVIDFSTCMSGCCQGSCVSFPRVELGGSCAEAGSKCAAGSFCSTATSVPTCVPQLGAGSTCTAAGQCSPELLCQLGSSSGSGTCRVLPEPGEMCDPTDGLCVDNDTYCDPVSSTCATRKSPDASCAAGLRSECNGYSVCVDGRCQPIPAPGETCTEALGCLHGEGCIVGHCYARTHEVCPLPM